MLGSHPYEDRFTNYRPDFSLEMKQDIDRYAAHMTDLISRLDAARDEVIKRDRRIEQLERENAELREKCVEVN